MKRENGYYWVRYQAVTDWEVSEWLGEKHNSWVFSWSDNDYVDSDFYEINETRILDPDEREALAVELKQALALNDRMYIGANILGSDTFNNTGLTACKDCDFFN